MARFRTVDFFPFEGFADRLWDSAEHPGDPLRDAVLRAARPVVACYTEALAAIEVTGPRAELLISMTRRSALERVELEVWRSEPVGGPERAFVTLCPDVARLDGPSRAELVLAIVHAAVQQLATARGWDPELFEPCRTHVVDRGYAYVWAGPWRSSPDRRHGARAVYTLAGPDGFGRARVEVRRRGEDEPSETSGPAVASCLASRFRHSAATLQWLGSDEVALRPLIGHGPGTGAITGRLEDGTWSFAVRDDTTVRAPGAGLAEDSRAPVPEVSASFG